MIEADRDYLRFLWYENGQLQSFRHCRVAFGISSSPFLLAATLKHHLSKSKEELQETAKLLLSSTYVDNCVASVDSAMERDKFIIESTRVCAEAQFELRGWAGHGTKLQEVQGNSTIEDWKTKYVKIHH